MFSHKTPKLLIYTFESFPKERLRKEAGGSLFVFGPLKAGLAIFLDIVREKRPHLILGIARGHKTQFERVAVNRFHGQSKINKTGREFYPLAVPKILPSEIRLAKRSSHSFCNWTAYKLSEAIAVEKLPISLMFSHANEKDVKTILELVQNFEP